jgi:citrate lyase subunit beta/citryl-CoA lyase
MIRSLLYVPAHSERFVAKAYMRGADAVILDLEDGVPPARKDAARANLPHAIASVGRNGAMVFVRVNSGDDRLDADAQAACRAGAQGLLLPKTQSAGMLHDLAARMAPVEHTLGREALRFIPMLEDPGAILDARAIASATPRVLALLTGGEDLATAMDAEPTPEAMRLPILLVHLAAKAAGVLSFGMLRSIADFSDLEGIAAGAREARALGFDGASCVHPAVVPILNRAFSPSAAELDRARRLVSAFEAAAAKGSGAFTFEGRMVDLPVYDRARKLLARAAR